MSDTATEPAQELLGRSYGSLGHAAAQTYALQSIAESLIVLVKIKERSF